MIWLRWSKNCKDCDLKFVAAKSFVAPTKKRSVPKLESMAMLVLPGLNNYVNNVLMLIKCVFGLVCWTCLLAVVCTLA